MSCSISGWRYQQRMEGGALLVVGRVFRFIGRNVLTGLFRALSVARINGLCWLLERMSGTAFDTADTRKPTTGLIGGPKSDSKQTHEILVRSLTDVTHTAREGFPVA
jgi:hypothetical protein